MTLEQAIYAHQRYLDAQEIEGDAKDRIRNHLGVDNEDDIQISSEWPRIILASSDFSTELTTSVLWLRQVGLDINCVKLQPCKAEDSVFVERSQVIPLPEAKDYIVQQREREREVELRQSAQSGIFPGSEVFNDSIETAKPSTKDKLRNLRDLAVSLEQQELASLSTRVESTTTTLHIDFPDGSRRLASVTKFDPGYGRVSFQGTSFDQYAPESKKRIEEILGQPLPRLFQRDLPDGFLEALREAYEEAHQSLSSGVND